MSKKSKKRNDANLTPTNQQKEYSQVENIQDKSPIVNQRTKIKYQLNINKRPLTEKQETFLKLALDKSVKMMLVSGPAGSSKTYISMYAGLELMNQKKLSDVIYIRSAVESSNKSLGFLPGEYEDKLTPYLEPLYDKLEELLPKGEIELLNKENRIEGKHVGFTRGANWNAKLIMIDEAQNMTFEELTTLMTRTGEFSKVFICGDPFQSDIGIKSGFKDMFNLFNGPTHESNGIHTFEFGVEDIVRSELVKHIVKTLQEYSQPRKK
jgi:phosphate starvation-inducible PhoH-like protein